MELILLEDIRSLGRFGAKVKVAKGYGRNYLIPQGKALPATADNVARFEARRAELEKAAQERLDEAQARAAKMADLSLTVTALASDEGKLYGSIGTADIVDALVAQGHDVSRQEVRLPEGGIHALGEYEVILPLHTEVEVTVQVNVALEGAVLDEEDSE